MAKDTAKKNMRKNASRMRLFTLFTWVVNVCALLSVLYHRGSFPWPRDLLGLAFFTLQEAAALALLRQFAAPTLGPAGELLDCPDVSNPAELGVYSWAQDVLWVCWAAQGLGFLVHWTGALLYLPVPVLAAGKLWALAAPMLKNRGEAVVAAESGPVQHTRAERRKQEILLRKKGTR